MLNLKKHSNFMLTLLFSLTVVLTPALAISADRDLGVTFMVGVPHPINLAIDKRLDPKWSLGTAFGSLGAKLQGGSVNVSVTNLEARGRWHPFSGAFILGSILGYQNIVASGEQNILAGFVSVPTKVSLSIKSLFLTPHLGWFWGWSSGFSIGFEFGVQVPLMPSSSFDISIVDPTLNSLLETVKQTSDYKALESKIETQANQIGNAVLPYVTALRLGWVF